MEKWKNIPNTNGIYFVSNKGHIKTIDRLEVQKTGRVCKRKGCILKGQNNGQGYYKISLKINGIKVKRYIHRLVAEAFIPNPNNYPYVNHKDFNPSNNEASNLEWTTAKGNYDYSANAGRYIRTETWKEHQKIGLDNAMAKSIIGIRITDGAITIYRALNDCSKDGFVPSCVSCCCNGIRKTHKGYTWRFYDEKTRHEKADNA